MELKRMLRTRTNNSCWAPNSHRIKQSFFFRAIALFLLLAFPVQAGLDHLGKNMVIETMRPGAFPVVASDQAAPIGYDSNDHKGVIRAIGDLQMDIERVAGKKPHLSTNCPASQYVVIIGTLGKNEVIDGLVDSGKLDTIDLKGKWESFVITTINDPAVGIEQALIIAGSDKRGTIYGVYELSEQLGVSPWYWWADVPPKKRKEAYIVPGRYTSGEPVVMYRGIFINDEEPCLGQWAREKFGGINSKMYAHMFELILRLRGNYLWPAMWGKSLYEDDSESARIADEYGIVLGTSHHEPMTRAQKDWTRARNNYGNGEWNYATNEEGLKKFWREGIERNKDHEVLVTLGMRGDGDEPMIESGDMEDNIKLLEKIIADQRSIIKKIKGDKASEVPLMWALYKEVKDYYDHGMKVPDDITLLWCDDNWGNIRRLPTAEERKRSGGAGIYYHFDYVGSPRSYKWINTNPLPKIWEQMNMAYKYGADRIWIVNVGDLKPMEIPIEFFMRMAWNPKAMPKEKISEFTWKWAEREFGSHHAEEIADVVSKYAKYNGWRKPELVDPDTFSVLHYREAGRVRDAWQEIIDKTEKIYQQIPEDAKDAFFQLVYYPVVASGTVHKIYIETGFNRLYATQGRASANDKFQLVRELFALDKQLTNKYHTLADGKWYHMMAQPHMGYVSWADPRHNLMPPIREIHLVNGPKLGVAIEGTEEAWPDWRSNPELPAFDSLNQQNHWIDVFRRGTEGFEFTASADKTWVKLSETSGHIDQDQRIWVSIDWDQVPVGKSTAAVTISRVHGQSTRVKVKVIRSEKFTRDNVNAVGGLIGPIVLNADGYSNNIAVDDVRWEDIPDYGRHSSGMAVFPVTAESVTPPENSPQMEYAVFITKAGTIKVDLITGISLNVLPDRGVRIAVSFNEEVPQILDAFEGQSYADPSKRDDPSSPPIRDWHQWVKDNMRTLKSIHQISEPGIHTLKVWMVDPGVILEKLIVHSEKLPDSYFGPPASQSY